jgi:hypothetical protein
MFVLDDVGSSSHGGCWWQYWWAYLKSSHQLWALSALLDMYVCDNFQCFWSIGVLDLRGRFNWKGEGLF